MSEGTRRACAGVRRCEGSERRGLLLILLMAIFGRPSLQAKAAKAAGRRQGADARHGALTFSAPAQQVPP